jgi:hypothetical protein
MKISHKTQISKCPIDERYVIVKVYTIKSPNWFERLFGKVEKVHCKEYRSINGVNWFKLPSFRLVYDLCLEREFLEWKEREAYILATEKTNKTP